MLRVRIKRPLDAPSDLLERRVVRDHRPVGESAAVDVSRLVQPLFHNYTAPVSRLQPLEVERRCP